MSGSGIASSSGCAVLIFEVSRNIAHVLTSQIGVLFVVCMRIISVLCVLIMYCLY